MLPDDRREPYVDENGGMWKFYKGSIPGTNFEYSYTLQLPPEIHNYVIDTYIGTDEQGPLPSGFHFTPQMIEDIARQSKEVDWPLDMETFRIAVEETVNHRYHVEAEERPFDFDDLVEQRERVVNEPLGLDQEPQILEDPPSPFNEKDLKQINKAIDEEQLGDIGPEHGDDFMSQDLLEPEPLNFGQSVKGIADYFKEKVEYFKEVMRDTFDTFGR